MDRMNIVKQDPRGFLYNVDVPEHRFSMDKKYLEYVQTYTDLEFEAEMFLNYRRYLCTLADKDAKMDIECKRRFGKHMDDVIWEIRDKIKYDICAKYILAGYITNEAEIVRFINIYESDRGIKHVN